MNPADQRGPGEAHGSVSREVNIDPARPQSRLAAVSGCGETLNSLQAGRGLAALAVVVHHASIAARDFGSQLPGQQWLVLGYLGVDFFFVLSGFIIYYSTVGSSKTVADYATARVNRVYIPYLPVGLGLAALYTLLPGVTAGDYRWSWLPTLTLLPIEKPALLVAWSLQHEVTFYFIFAVAFFSRRLVPVLALWGLLIALNTATVRADIIPLRLINLEFLMGVVVAMLKDRWTPPLRLAPIPALCWLLLGADRNWSIWVGLSCALAIWNLVNRERAGKLAVSRSLIFLGAASYAIYLTHSLAISAVGRLFAGMPRTIFLACLPAGAATGIAYFLLIERPLLRTARSFSQSAKWTA